MSREARLAIIGAIGIVLLIFPTLFRTSLFQHQGQSYVPPPTDEFTTAATPIPTSTALSQLIPVAEIDGELKPGPVVVDLAHFNRIDRSKFQPLASALAQRGVGMRFWLPLDIDPLEIQSFLDFPDQSDKLIKQLEDASAIIIVSPFFLWTPQEIEVLIQFVADGGRLYLVSDPDNIGDVARDINNVGDPFGVVFNDDYLYNTEYNDENFTYIFQGQFLDRAEELTDSKIVFYGARSIIGSVKPQIISDEGTLSSARTGVTGFTTVAIGGVPLNDTEGRVLAMSDFDVLSEPFVTRYQNQAMVEFVANFLTAGARKNTLTDFPSSLGKEIALVYGSDSTVDSDLLSLSARLQQQLLRSGRSLILSQSAPLDDGQIISSTQMLTGPLASLLFGPPASTNENSASSTASSEGEAPVLTQNGSDGTRPIATYGATIPPVPTAAFKITEKLTRSLPSGDLIYLADFETAGRETSLLADAGFTLIHVARTPTPTPTPVPTATATPTTAPQLLSSPTASLEVSNGVTTGSTLSATVGITSGVSITATRSVTVTRQVQDDSSMPAAQSPPSEQVNTAGGSVPPVGTGMITASAVTTFTATPAPTPEPLITAYLVSDRGLQLLAAETLVLFQQENRESGDLIAVLGADSEAIQAGLTRLLEQDYDECVIGDNQVICPYAQSRATPTATRTGNGEMETVTPVATIPGGTLPPESTATAEGTPAPEATREPVAPGVAKILVIDDDDTVADGEVSEADFYINTLINLRTSPDLWSIAARGTPTGETLKPYNWVIWSSAGYGEGGPTVADLDPIFEYLNEGGHITISSRSTFFGQTQDPPSQLRDVRKTNDLPGLVEGLPAGPIILGDDIPAVAPLQANTAENPSLTVVLRRGPESEDADAPLLFTLVDDDPEATGAKLMVLGMSVDWLPGDVSEQLLSNMMTWMLE